LCGKRKVHPRFGWGDLREKDHFEGINLDDGILLKRIFKK
jgi:hypothetical protein